MIVKNIVVIDGEEVEIKNLKDKEIFVDKINTRVLNEWNYIVEKTA